MKTELNGTSGSRATKLTPPRVRLTPSRFPGRKRGLHAKRAGAIHDLAPPASTADVDAAEPNTAEKRGGDSLQLYLREIGRVKLLTPKEEIALARRIKRGDKQAREQMITANLRLVVKIARDYEGLGM